MTLIKMTVCCLVACFFCLSLRAQPPSRCTLSFNPFGLIEPPAAIGLGVGYRLNRRVEIWSETSFLTNIGTLHLDGPLTGVRQILQAKYFIDKGEGFFVAAEGRYKSYQYRDKLNFVNPDTHDTLFNFSNFSRHYFWGVGLQVGWRKRLSANERFQLELTAGLGFRIGRVVRQNVPRGYEYKDLYPPKDARIEDLSKGFLPYYLPGSIRLIYLFGKRLRP